MRIKLTILLLLLNAVFFSYLLYLDKNEEVSLSDSRLVFSPGTIEQAEVISINNTANGDRWEVRRIGERWMLQQPVLWPANPYAMKSLTTALRSLRWETRFAVEDLADVGRKLESYGLGDAASTLTLRTGGQEIVIRLGAPTEIGSRLYVLSPDEKEVYVVQRQILEGLDLVSDRLFDRQIIQVPPVEVRSIFIQGGDSGSLRVELAREGENWVLRAPIRVAASNKSVNAALDQLYLMTVEEFVDVTPSIHGLDTPTLRLNLDGNQRQQTLLLGNLVPDAGSSPVRYAKLEAYPTIFTLDEKTFLPWKQPQESLRERTIAPFSPSSVSAVQIAGQDLSLNLQKLESGRWQLVTSGGDGNLRTLTADPAVMDDLLERLSTLEALEFVSDAPSDADLERYGLNQPQRVITVRLTNDEVFEINIGDFPRDGIEGTATNRLYVRRSSTGSVYLTTASVLAVTPLSPLHYRERIAETLPTGSRITALRIIDLESSKTLLAANVLNDDTLEAEGELIGTQTKALLALKNAFRRFPIEQFVSETFTDPLVLDRETQLEWSFALEADLQIDGSGNTQRQTKRYVLTERLGGKTQFAGSEALGLVFTLPLPLIDALHPVLFDRPRPDAQDNPNPVEPAAVISPQSQP